jgi:hypothetical protein
MNCFVLITLYGPWRVKQLIKVLLPALDFQVEECSLLAYMERGCSLQVSMELGLNLQASVGRVISLEQRLSRVDRPIIL